MKQKNIWNTVKLLYLIIAGALFAFALTQLPHLRGITVEQLIAYTPENLWLAAAAILLLYLIKAMVVFFPLLALYIAVGTMFSGPVALAVNAAGLFLCISAPYFLGRILGAEWMCAQAEKRPALRKVLELGKQNALFVSFGLRAINLLPGDIVSLVLGASGMRFSVYAAGSMLGLLPVMIPATLLGYSLQDTTQGRGVLVLCSGILLLLILLGLGIWGRRQKRKLLEQ